MSLRTKMVSACAWIGLGSWLPFGSSLAQQGPFSPPPTGPDPATPFAPPLSGPPPVQPPADDGGLFSTGFFLQMGFSFIVGLAVGFAAKIAFKIALVVGGLLLVALFALQHAGMVDINWTGMESNYDSAAGWLAVYAGGLKDFMADNLSNTASFTAGLLVGLKL